MVDVTAILSDFTEILVTGIDFYLLKNKLQSFSTTTQQNSCKNIGRIQRLLRYHLNTHRIKSVINECGLWFHPRIDYLK